MHAWQSYHNCLYILIQLHNRQHRNSISSTRPHSKEHVRKQACRLYQMSHEGHSGVLPGEQSRCCQVKWSFSWSRGRFVFLCARSPCVYMSVCVLVLFLLLLWLDIACPPLTSAKSCHFEWYLKYSLFIQNSKQICSQGRKRIQKQDQIAHSPQIGRWHR